MLFLRAQQQFNNNNNNNNNKRRGASNFRAALDMALPFGCFSPSCSDVCLEDVRKVGGGHQSAES
jgi:hypothetical protein